MFDLDDVHNNPVSAEFFEVENRTYSGTVPGAYSLGEPCVYIKLKNGYSVKGKVTLPKMINGVKVGGLSAGLSGSSSNTSLNGFSYNTEITHIFWEDGAVPEAYSDYCLAYCTNLAYVEFPTSLTAIRQFAFRGCQSLENRTLAHCTYLLTIGGNAFNRAFKPTANTTFLIPGSVTTLSANTFSYNDTTNDGNKTTIITTFQIGNTNDPSKLESLPSGSTSSFATTNNLYTFYIYINDADDSRNPWPRFREMVGASEVNFCEA